MKKISFLVLLVSFIGLNTKAQDNDEAKKILDRSFSKTNAAKGINASFALTQKDKNNHLLGDAKGIVKIKGNKYYVKQDETQVFCNGIQTWNFDGQNEVTITKVDNDDTDDLSPRQLLSGFNNADFSFKLISSSGTNYQVQVLPVDKRKNFKEIQLFINKSTSLVTKARIIDKSGNTTEIVFSNINLNASIPDSQFSFDVSKHPGIEIINQ